MRARTHSNRVEAASYLECDSDAGVEDATIERCPRIDGPAAVDGSDGPEQRAPIRLAYIREVFRIRKHPQLPDPSFNEAPKQHVGGALAPVRIVFETLGPDRLQPAPNPPAIPRSHRAVHPGARRGLTGAARGADPLPHTQAPSVH